MSASIESGTRATTATAAAATAPAASSASASTSSALAPAAAAAASATSGGDAGTDGSGGGGNRSMRASADSLQISVTSLGDKPSGLSLSGAKEAQGSGGSSANTTAAGILAVDDTASTNTSTGTASNKLAPPRPTSPTSAGSGAGSGGGGGLASTLSSPMPAAPSQLLQSKDFSAAVPPKNLAGSFDATANFQKSQK